jgi:hypothetical protein
MKTNKIPFFILGLLVLTVSCSHSKKSSSDEFHTEFYAVLNYITDTLLTDVSVMSSRTLRVIKPIQSPAEKLTDSATADNLPEFNVIQYNWLSIYPFAERRNLNKEDVDFMYKSIDPTRTFLLDSNRVKLPVMTEKKFSEFFQDSGINKGYERIKRKYGTSCYISVSTPVFNSNYTKVIISISYLCGPMWGNGYEFILEKKNGKWTIMDKYITWES